MRSYNRMHTWSLIKTLFVNLFSSRYFIVIADLIITTLISIHVANINNSKTWKIQLIIYIIVSILINCLCILTGRIKQQTEYGVLYFNKVYEIQNRINFNTANNLYRVNKKVSNSIRQKSIEKGAINSIIDFQTLSFFICNELFSFLIDNFECGDCEVTIFQRFVDNKGKDFVKMIAYKNSKNSIPSTYGKEFKLSHKTESKVPVFVKIFNNLNANIKILPNKKEVQKEFDYFEDSMNREREICQYIGIPIKTNRNKIEILLQIDVTKEKALGRKYNSLMQFSEYILSPFCNLLYCSYERDLIFNKFYDILEENIIMRRM